MKSLRLTPEQYQAHQKRTNERLSRLVDAMPLAKPKGAKAHKYGNVPVNGYASGRESKRAAELRLMAAAGAITDLKEQVRYELIPAQYLDGKCVERACTYVCDFQFMQNGKLRVQDAKGFRTPVWAIKRKLMLHVHGIVVEEV